MKARTGRPRSTRQLRSTAFGKAFLALLLSFSAAACAKAPLRPADEPMKQAAHLQETDAERRFEDERRHVAPPPAYGNKVVSATAADVTPEG